MSKKYADLILEQVKSKLDFNERALEIKQSKNKFIIETMNFIPSLPFSAIEAKDIKPCDIVINESGNILNVDAVEINEDSYQITFTDEHGCELKETFTTNKVMGFVDISEGEEINEYGDKIEVYEDSNKKVKLNKIMHGDVKKYKVYVKNDKGNVVKVNFGDPNMEIKRDNPARRKNFRARHHCENPGPRWKAKYWACKTWSAKPVSSMLKEDVQVNSIKEDKCIVIKENIKKETLNSLNAKPYNPDLYGLIKNRTK